MSLLRKNILLLLFMQGANYLIPLMTFPYLTRVLGVSQFGVYAFILTLSQYFVLVTDFGFNLSASKRIAQANGNKKTISEIYWATISAKCLIGILCGSVVLVIYFFNVNNPDYNGVVFILFTIVGSVFTPIWFFQGIEKISALTLTNITSRAMAIPLILWLVTSTDDANLAMLVQGAVAILAATISQVLVYRSGIIIKINFSFAATIVQLKDSFPLFISTVAISLYTMSTPVILKLVSNSYEVGLYGSADRLRGALIGLFLVVGSAIYPRVNNLFTVDKVQMYQLLRKIVLAKCFFALTIIVGIWLFAPQLVAFILGEEFIVAADVLKVMSPQFFTVLMSVTMANYLLLPFGYRREYMLLPIFTCILHAGLCFFLATKFGAIGGAISVTSVEAVSMCILVYLTYSKGLHKGFFCK
ncbi:flippase [Aeromonas sp. R7-4]|uniref:flippase n=1 Tax=Aeromonas sp. R7-4 TaxID=3138476 RepID=UPI0034A4E63D